MTLEVAVRQTAKVAILDINGQITLGESAGLLRDRVNESLAQGQKNILLNLQEVSFIDSAGLGELVRSHAASQHRGGKLKLLHPHKRVQNLLKITRLDAVLESFEDEAAALSSF